MAEIRGSTGIPPGIEIRFPKAHESPENPPPGYCCAFEIFFSTCGLSFPLPELVVRMMFELGFALPQMCPNFVWTVLCLQTLGEEFDYQLSSTDFLQVYTVKTGRTKGTLYVSPLYGLKVFDDLPEKDEKWRKSYFFFPVNELTFGHLASLHVSKWTSKIGRVVYFVRLKGRSLVWSDPPSTSGMSYREERACRIAEKEAKRQMAATLAEGNARIPAKNTDSSAPQVSEVSIPRASPSEISTGPSKPSAGPSEPPVIVIADSSDEPRENEVPPPPLSKGPTEASSQRVEPSKKRKEPETSSSLREKTRARSSSSGDERGRSSSKDGAPFSEKKSRNLPSTKESGGSSGKLPSKEQSHSPQAFADMSEVNRANFFRFADKIGELMIEFNNSVASYEDQLFASPSTSEVNQLKERVVELETHVAEFTKLEAINAKPVEKAEQIRARMKKAEVEVLDLGVANEDLRGKLKKAGDLYYEATENEKALRDQESAEGGETSDEANSPAKIRAAEFRANRMLVEEISRGEIQDIEAELGLLRADEEVSKGYYEVLIPDFLDTK
ncbi:PREDICTED: uncharacterized protein At3g60930, chloroplastic-like [Camelina sativa]|uniref:Uncharacterized protein At3g60930, chloroplastic-like n=1 Tax=Camelina sativa TaxID=90675 RepID=A0ABM0T0B9_CAMSA|nr:PREDICTED: uncharacterized protein At3g60930, chloroplastic-like [Camelina sativa]